MSFVLSKPPGVAATVGCPPAATVPDNYVNPLYTDPVSKGTWLDGATWVDWTLAGAGLSQGGGVSATADYLAYRKFGKSVKYSGGLRVTGTGSAGSAIQIQTPGNMRGVSIFRPLGTVIIFDQSANQYWKGLVVPVGISSIQFLATSTTSANFLGAVDFTAALTNLDFIAWDMEYEIP